MQDIIRTCLENHTAHQFLSAKDLYTLSKTCKTFENLINDKTINDSIISKINSRLERLFGDKTKEFKDLLCETKAVISGSFIIQCILGEEWNSDIDIFIPIKDAKLFRAHVENGIHSGLLTLIDRFLYDDADFAEVGYNNYDGVLGAEYGIHTTRTYAPWNNDRDVINNSEKIQLILVNCPMDYNVMKNFIFESFDFEICKNIYYNDEQDNIVISNMNDILEKTLTFETAKKTVGNTVERAEKYEKRGFVIRNRPDKDYVAELQKRRESEILCGPTNLYASKRDEIVKEYFDALVF